MAKKQSFADKTKKDKGGAKALNPATGKMEPVLFVRMIDVSPPEKNAVGVKFRDRMVRIFESTKEIVPA